MAPRNYADGRALQRAHAEREDAQGQSSIIDEIKKAFANPLRGNPVALAKVAQDATARVPDNSRVPASPRAQDPNADDALDKDEDDMDMDEDEDEDDADMAVTGTEAADIETRRKLRAKADRKKNARNTPLEQTAKMIKSVHAQGAVPAGPDWTRATHATPATAEPMWPSAVAIRDAQTRPFTSLQKLFASGYNNHPIDMDAVQRIVARGRSQMRKSSGIPADVWNRMTWQERRDAVAKADSTIRFSSRPNFPPNSVNQSLSNDPLCDDGASTSTPKLPVPSQPFSTVMGGFTDSQISPNDSRMRAAIALGSNDAAKENLTNALDAIKRDQQRGRRTL